MHSSEDRLPSRAPVWFEEDHLKDETFDPRNYVTELCRYVPLETICQQLEVYLSQLKLELVDVINVKYNDFVGLASQLSGVEGAIVRMGKPLTEFKKKLGMVERGIESECRLLSATLEHRQKIKAARRSLETMQNATHIASKIEKLALEVHTALQTDDIPQKSVLLERVAREIGRLNLLFRENQELALIEASVQQNVSMTEQMEKHVVSCLQTVFALESADHASAFRLLNALSVLGKVERGEALIRETLIGPFLQECSQRENETQYLRPWIVKVAEEMDGIYHGFLLAVLETSAGLQHYDVIGNCILAALHEHVSNYRPSVFFPGKPDVFLENFKASMEFIDALEHRCPTVSALEQFRGGVPMKQFMKAWNLQVYFAMRFQEIAGIYDSSLESEQVSMGELSDGFFFRVMSIWIQCLQQCSNPQIVVKDLQDQFTKLFFKLLSRFELWFRSSIDHLLKEAAEGNDAPQTRFPQKNEELALLERDVTHACAVLETEFYLDGLHESCREVVRKLVLSFLSRIQEQQRRLLHVIGEHLFDECTAIIKKSVKTASSTMFRPGGDHPTVANDYVKRLLEPLQLFLESHSVASYVTEEVKGHISTHVARRVCVAYRQALEDVLSFWEKSRMSLRRLNKGRLTVSPEATGDSGKGDELSSVYHQHWLDVCAFGQIVKEHAAADLPEYTELRNLIISKREAYENPSP